MSTLEQMPLRALSPRQQSVLALMDVDLYQRRRLPRAPVPAGAWSDADSATPLARAVARAAGMAEVRQWCELWQAAGMTLPDLAELRTSPAAKRALWRQLRTRRR